VPGRSSLGCQLKISIKSQTVLKRGQKKAKAIISRPEKDQILFVALLFLCHIGTPKLQEYHYKYYSKFGLSLAGLVLELITDVSLTFHGL